MKPAISPHRLRAPGIPFQMIPSLLLLLLLTLNALGQQPDINGFAVLRLNEVNSHAARHFLSNFSPSTVVKWFREEQHYIASFKEGDSTDRAYYKSNGNFDFCIKYYRADDLDAHLKSAVLEKFPGCEILTITELTDLQKTDLFIKIKDGAYIRTLSCSDEGIVITENIKDGGS
jgi:hypothetical protein